MRPGKYIDPKAINLKFLLNHNAEKQIYQQTTGLEPLVAGYRFSHI